MHSHQCDNCKQSFTCDGDGSLYEYPTCKQCDKRLCSDERPCHLCREEVVSQSTSEEG